MMFHVTSPFKRGELRDAFGTYDDPVSLHNNAPVCGLDGLNDDQVREVALPNFDLHNVEEALLVNHRLYGGKPMTRAEVQDAIEQYRLFLRNHKLTGMPEQFKTPSFLVDRVWHAHICETEQYARDCQGYFGKFFHHASGLCTGTGDGQGTDGGGTN